MLARSVGVLLAGLSAIVNFAFLFGWNQPFWSMLIIALDVAIIWALTMHGRDIAQSSQHAPGPGAITRSPPVRCVSA